MNKNRYINYYPDLVDSRLINRLIVLEQKVRSMGMQMRNEAAVARQELADRQRKGLTGDAAIAHYNEWMQRFGMDYLMVR